MQKQKELGPKNLYGAFAKIAEYSGGRWIFGIVLIIIFSLIFKIWAKTNLIPALFLLGIAIRISGQQYPIHRMFETITLSAIIIALHFNPFLASIFAISAFLFSRFFGPVEDPIITLQLGVITVIVAYLAPFMAPHYTFLMLVIYLSVIRTLIFTTVNFLIVKSISIFVLQTFWALLVGVGFNYALVLFLIGRGLI